MSTAVSTSSLNSPKESVQTAKSNRQRVQQRVSAPPLSVVIVNYCQWSAVWKLVRSLRGTNAMKTGAAEIVIADNRSPWDRHIGRLRRMDGVSLRRWRHNGGYARAVNEGCRLSRGDWFLLLNPDVTPEPGFLDGIAGAVNRLTSADARVGIVGFQLLNADGTVQMSAGEFPSLPGTLLGLLRPRALRKYRSCADRGRRRVAWVTGCCLLINRECLRDLGGLDEDFFLYYEDVDFCRRARARGWSVWFEPSLRAVHQRPLHGRKVSSLVRLFTRHSLLTYSFKHWRDRKSVV